MPFMQVWFESPPGVPHVSISFNPGESVRVAGRVDVFEIGGLAWPVTIDLFDNFSPMQWVTQTGTIPFVNMGEFYVDIVLPTVVTQATVRVAADGGIWGVARWQVGIGIGVQAPVPPTPKDWLDQLKPWLIGAGVVLVAMYAAPVLVPLVGGAARSAKGAFK